MSEAATFADDVRSAMREAAFAVIMVMFILLAFAACIAPIIAIDAWQRARVSSVCVAALSPPDAEGK